MRIAVVGAGISGLCVAYYLRNQHDITVLEANDYAGGHTNTIDVPRKPTSLPVDTGFIVFNDRTYPNFCRLLEELQVSSQASDMSFGVRCDLTGLEYAGTGLNGLFAQRSNVFRPGFWRLLRDWRRFGRESHALLNSPSEDVTVGEYFEQNSFSREFREQYFLPIGSAIWSCPHQRLEQFPMRFIVQFYQNHGLLTLDDPPTWRVVSGGSRRYVEALLKHLARPVQVNCPVSTIRREGSEVAINLKNGERQRFDHVVLACHADQSLRLLGSEATPTERTLLGSFPYEQNIAVLHTDIRVLPKSPRAWASWNYHIRTDRPDKATVTYHMNRLQGLNEPEQYCVTLNGEDQIDPARVIRTITYHHPVFSLSRLAAQQRHRELIAHRGISYCGAYWGNGFHEDGVNSALAVCEVLRGVATPAQVVCP
jgi:predicted NAD/FAD-binding protein